MRTEAEKKELLKYVTKVTVGEKTITVGDKTYDIADVKTNGPEVDRWGGDCTVLNCVPGTGRKDENEYNMFEEFSQVMTDGDPDAKYMIVSWSTGAGMPHNFKFLPNELDLTHDGSQNILTKERAIADWERFADMQSERGYLTPNEARQFVGQFMSITPCGVKKIE